MESSCHKFHTLLLVSCAYDYSALKTTPASVLLTIQSRFTEATTVQIKNTNQITKLNKYPQWIHTYIHTYYLMQAPLLGLPYVRD
jgi:hypothetical protein